jgi:hypothetical protein
MQWNKLGLLNQSEKSNRQLEVSNPPLKEIRIKKKRGERKERENGSVCFAC